MPVRLYRWVIIPLLFALATIPIPSSAQGKVTLESVSVQLWPEYDQPDMLVILNAQLASTVSLPVELTFQLPGTVEEPYVVAVGPTAQTVSDQNIDFTYQKNGEWLEVTVTAENPAIRIEYYDSELIIQGEDRSFEFLWPGTFAANVLSVNLKVPVDTTQVITEPQMRDVTPADSEHTFLEWSTRDLEAGEQVPITISYNKTSDRLSAAGQPLQAGPVDVNTAGRVSLSNYLPFIFGGLGVLLILGGGVYIWQTGRAKPKPRKRTRKKSPNENGEQVYCHQCGKRAQPNDRFCRTCGTRIRQQT